MRSINHERNVCRNGQIPVVYIYIDNAAQKLVLEFGHSLIVRSPISGLLDLRDGCANNFHKSA